MIFPPVVSGCRLLVRAVPVLKGKGGADCMETFKPLSRTQLQGAVDLCCEALACSNNGPPEGVEECVCWSCLDAVVETPADFCRQTQCTACGCCPCASTASDGYVCALIQCGGLLLHQAYSISDWDTSLIKDMNSVFRYKAAFNQDISRWVTSQACACADSAVMVAGTRAARAASAHHCCL